MPLNFYCRRGDSKDGKTHGYDVILNNHDIVRVLSHLF